MDDAQYKAEEIEEGKSAAILAYIPFACLVPLLKWRDNRFVWGHAKQGLALFVVELIAIFLLIPGMAAFVVKLVLTLALFWR